MSTTTKSCRLAVALAIAAATLLVPAPARAAGFNVTNLVSNQPGVAPVTDPNLANPWGVAISATSPFWISDNATGLSTLYTGTGAIIPLVVTIPPPAGTTITAAPTGIVFNGTTDFQFTNAAAVTKPAAFIFDTEDGTISAWAGGAAATLVVDRSQELDVYKGMALVQTSFGNFLFVTDFRHNRVDVLDSTFHRVFEFTDHFLPRHYAAYGIANLNGVVYITFAKQDRPRHDSVAGEGDGFVDAIDLTRGTFRRLVSRGPLNAPWGLAIAPASFGPLAGALLVGNFGNGWINAFDPHDGHFLGSLKDATGAPIVEDKLWTLIPGNDHAAGSSQDIYFTAGPDDETNGLFGSISPAP